MTYMNAKKNGLKIIREKQKRNAHLNNIFLGCMKEVFKISKIKHKKHIFNCSEDGLINYILPHEGNEAMCLHTIRMHSEVFENIESLNQFIFNNWFNSTEVVTNTNFSEVTTKSKHTKVEIKLSDVIKNKIIKYIKNELQENEKKFTNEAEEVLQYEDYISVSLNISVRANFKYDEKIVRSEECYYPDHFKYNKMKTIKNDPIALDKACFIILIISNYVDCVLESSDRKDVNDFIKKHGFIFLLLKVLDSYSQTLLERDALKANNDLIINSYLSDPGKRKVAIKTRLKELLENFQNEDFPKEIIELSILHGSFRRIKLELGIP